MNLENKKRDFLGSCGVFLKEQVHIPAAKKLQDSKQLANKETTFFSVQKRQAVEWILCW